MTTNLRDREAEVSNIVHKMMAAITLERGSLTSSDIAGLRRMDPERLDAPGFWKIAGIYLDDRLPGDAEARRRLETAWGAILVGLAHLGNLHVPGERLGNVLARAELSEPRFVRLMRADATRLLDELPSLARYLRAKQISTDWSWAARLLLYEIRGDAEQTRRAIARDYYATLSSRSQSD